MDKFHSEIILKKCIHTKNVFSMLDLNIQDESLLKMKKHIEQCQICKKVYEDFRLKCLEMKVHIPKPIIDIETKEIFTREIAELFKTFELNQKAILKKKIKNNIKLFDRVGASFIKNLTSKTMLASYAFGLMLFAVLKKIL